MVYKLFFNLENLTGQKISFREYTTDKINDLIWDLDEIVFFSLTETIDAK
jgi:hypothetical protein